MDFMILRATTKDAPFLAETVMSAIGEDHCIQMAGGEYRLPLLRKFFTLLAVSEVSQYSYRNAFVAYTRRGERAGAIICYDGADLERLRQPFIDEANCLLGWDITAAQMKPETSDDEMYLDSLMVLPKFRRQGLGRKLIGKAAEKAAIARKPLGLLVDFDNPSARNLYAGAGFKNVGERPFAGKMMEHMQLPTD